MSEVKRLADAEAAKAEAESPDEEAAESEEVEGQEGTPETPPEPAPQGEPTPDDIKAFRSEHARHEKALIKIMGDDFQMLVVCDECGGMGFRPPYSFKPNEKYKACDTCAGMGDVLTGSRKQGNETQPCPVCAGRGFLERMPAAPAATPTANGEQAPTEYGTPGWMGDPQLSASGGFVAPVGG